MNIANFKMVFSLLPVSWEVICHLTCMPHVQVVALKQETLLTDRELNVTLPLD